MRNDFQHIAGSLFALLLLLVTSVDVALAEGRNNPCKKLAHQKLRSVSELVDQAEYIGVYEVLKVTKDDVSLYANRESYSYLISQLRPIKGNNPVIAHISGQEPLASVPQEYLALEHLHGEIPEGDADKYGRSTFLVSSDGERCLVAPRFMLFYKYLVFGGLDSSIAFEPVHHYLDPWYRRVITEVQNENP